MKSLAIAAVTALSLTAPALSQNLIDGTDLDAVVNAARGFGAASLQEDDNGPVIRGRIDGTPYFMFFRNCNDAKTTCDDFFLQAYFLKPVVDMDLVNAWNRDKRWIKVYYDSDQDAVLEMDVDLTGGVTGDNLDQAFSYWVLGIEQFSNYFTKK